MEANYRPKSYKKVFIRDILKNANSETHSLDAPHHVKSKIDVMGTVVSVHVKKNLTSYHVDDSTGVICCVCFQRKNIKDENELSVNCIKKGVMLRVKGTAGFTSNILCGLEKLLNRLDEKDKVFNLGDTVNVLGTLNYYNGQTQVIEDFSSKIDDPNGQTQRILEEIIHLQYVHK